MTRKPLGWLGLCAAWGLAQAQTGQDIQAHLPPAAVVQQVLLASPAVQAAMAQKSAQMHRAQMTAQGPGEFTVRINQQTRRVQQPRDGWTESSVSLERPLRWWGKAALDGDLARQGREVARIAYADALHEASRTLMQQWFAWRKAGVDLESARTDLALAERLMQQAQARLKRGDISQLDADLAQAEVLRCQAALQTVQSQHAAALVTLSRQYPGLPLATSPLQGQALPPMPPLEQVRQPFLDKHHELNLRRAEAQRLRLLAERIDKERWPDPTLGVYTLRERQGAEQVLGVSLSLPLAGQARQSHALATQAEAQSAQDKVQQLQTQLGADLEARWAQLQHQKQALVQLQAAARIQAQAADKSQRAYAAGEHTMTELLQNRRLANEQHRQSERALWEAVEQQALLTLDLHQIWDFDD